MSAMDDFHIGSLQRFERSARVGAARDILLALGIVVLAALALQTNNDPAPSDIASMTAPEQAIEKRENALPEPGPPDGMGSNRRLS